ncbi:MAG: glycosyltransferase family 4 protein [Planctomycetota bacterium]
MTPAEPPHRAPAFDLVLDVWDPTRGGLESYAEQLCTALLEADHRVRIITGAVRQPPPPRAAVIETGGRGPTFYRAADALTAHGDARVLSFRHPGHEAHVFLPLGGLLAASLEARRRAEPPSIRWLRRTARALSPRTNAFLRRERAFFAAADRTVLASSELVGADIRRRFAAFTGSIAVTGLPIDEARFTVPTPADRRRTRAELALDPTAPCLLWIGNDPVRKGLPAARAVLRALRGDHPEATLVLAGHGSERLNGAEPGLRGVGHVGHTPRLIHAADVLLAPSLEDNLSLVVLEALASGLAVVTTQQNGACHYIQSARVGRVVTDAQDAEALLRATRTMLAVDTDDPAARQERRAAVATCFRGTHFQQVIALLRG